MTMQGDQLRAIRRAAGMTQEAFAAALGMSRKSVNMMENGQAPIEQRTELAAQYLAPRDPAITVGGKSHGRTFWIGRTQDQIQLINPQAVPPYIKPGQPGTGLPRLDYRYSGVTLPESGERVFVPADEEGWDEARARREALAVIQTWRESAGTAQTDTTTD